MLKDFFATFTKDSYYHQGRKQSQKTGRLCLQTVGWKKAFYKTLSVNIPKNSFQCLQTPVTQDGRDESLRQVQFTQETSLHPAMHTVPRCHSMHTLHMGVCHDHSTLHGLSLKSRGVQVTQTSSPWAQKLPWSYRQLIIWHRRDNPWAWTPLFNRYHLEGKRGEIGNGIAQLSSTHRNDLKVQTDPDPFPSRSPRAKALTNTPPRIHRSFVPHHTNLWQALLCSAKE